MSTFTKEYNFVFGLYFHKMHYDRDKHTASHTTEYKKTMHEFKITASLIKFPIFFNDSI